MVSFLIFIHNSSVILVIISLYRETSAVLPFICTAFERRVI